MHHSMLPYISHARSRDFAWHLHWLSTTEGKIIVKLLAISQTRQFQLFLTNLPSNFRKITQPIGKIKNTVSSRFINLYFPRKKSSSERTWPYWQWIVCTMKKGKCCVVTHRAADFRVAWLVYLACLSSHALRAYFNFENKRPWLLYLGDAQIIMRMKRRWI